MLPFQQQHYAALPQWEGKIPWLYLDAHKPNPLPTAGIGCAIGGLVESLTLPWTLNGVPATAEQITADWNRVTALPGARVAGFYKSANSLLLSETAIAALVQKRYDVFTPEIVQVFPQFMSWPVPAQVGGFDLIWGCGEGRPAGPGRAATGLYEFTHFRAAALAQDWASCAIECAEDPSVHAYDERNAWRKGLFLQAAALPKAA